MVRGGEEVERRDRGVKERVRTEVGRSGRGEGGLQVEMRSKSKGAKRARGGTHVMVRWM